jgi:beta-lactamase regulating signal transducer with metallopeptidase domain
MIAAWMAYATLVAVFACLAALTAERALRLTRRPGRWVWIGAMTLACVVPLVATRRSFVRSELAAATSTYVLRTTANSDPQDGAAFPLMPSAVAVAPSSTLFELDRPLIVAWILGSLVWSLVLAASAVAVTRRRRNWTTSVIDAVPVLISRDVGPAVVGTVRPEIVVPAWVTTLTPEQRALVLAHEHEHARARDPVLLAAGALTLVAMPWNAALWYALSRLRLAVEADCDGRVLRIHPDVRAYSSLLLDVTERNLRSARHLAALGDSRSELARRLALLTARMPRHLAVRVLGAALLSLTCVIIACETPKPSAGSRESGASASVRPDSTIRPDSSMASTNDSTADRSTDVSSRSQSVKLRGASESRIDARSPADTLMPVSRRVIEQALDELAARPDSLLTPADIRKLANFVRGRRIESPSADEPPPVPSAVIRRAVETHYPTALTGGMGRRPYLWFVGDRTNRVLGFASGREGLGVDQLELRRRGLPSQTLTDAITWGSVVRMVPGTPPSAQRRGDLLQVATFPIGADTVVVVWARLWGETRAP